MTTRKAHLAPNSRGFCAFVNISSIRWDTLQFVGKRSIINEVGCQPAKGGCCDNDGGLHHSQGGVTGTGPLHLHGERNATQRQNAGLSRRQGVAYRSIRVRGMEKTEAETESVPVVSGKLNSSSVARCDSVSIGTRHQTAVEPYYLFVILPYGKENGKPVDWEVFIS